MNIRGKHKSINFISVILILIDNFLSYVSLCVTLKFFENVVSEKKTDITHSIGR